MESFDQLLKFTDLLHKYRAVERRVLVQGAERQENDTEHSFTLAMLAWYINSTYKLGLDSDTLFRYALAHDLVEVYAGDTFLYQIDKQAEDKREREDGAAKRLRTELKEFPELHLAIEAYEKREDRESKFIYALDKVEPILSIYLDGGRSWRREDVTLDMIKVAKSEKVKVDEVVEKIFKDLIARLDAEHDALFNKVEK